MISAFYSATSGALGFQNKLNITANNIANASTNGFKSQGATFADLLYTDLQAGGGEGETVQIGNGVRIVKTSQVFEQGALEETGSALDVALAGDGFFAVQGQDGETYYTRAGSFHISKLVDKSYLVTANGDKVLNAQMEPIEVEGDAAQLRLKGPSGESAGEEGTEQLAVMMFDNPYALENCGGNNYKANAQSGEAAPYEEAVVVQGSLERSSVDMSSEMVHLIEAQRGFQLNVKLIQSADELESIANSLR